MIPTLSILIVTYDRPEEIRKTVLALRDNIRYDGPLHWHIADDHSPGTYLHDLGKFFQSELGVSPSVTITDRLGWGSNVNKGMVYLWDKVSDFVFLCEDDYVCMSPIDLDSGMAVLRSNSNIGLIRYDGIAGHSLDLQLREVDTSRGRVQVLAMALSSPHLNMYSNRPHLKHRRFHDRYGLYREGVKLGQTEEKFAHKVKDNYADGPKIAVLQDGIPRRFDHIGKSRQGSELDRGGNP